MTHIERDDDFGMEFDRDETQAVRITYLGGTNKEMTNHNVDYPQSIENSGS
jgi:hypothetical protein